MYGAVGDWHTMIFTYCTINQSHWEGRNYAAMEYFLLGCTLSQQGSSIGEPGGHHRALYHIGFAFASAKRERHRDGSTMAGV